LHTIQVAACPDDEQTYWLGTEVSGRNCLGSSDAMVASVDVTHGYLIWAALTDRWELKPDETAEAASAMREAAREWFADKDDPAAGHAYLDRDVRSLWLSESLAYECSSTNPRLLLRLRRRKRHTRSRVRWTCVPGRRHVALTRCGSVRSRMSFFAKH
jgi:hypothetical protein